MTTLKLNSRGTEVQILQSLLHITPDGIFGPKTQTALIAFQRQHSLTPDGICGAKTWAALGILTAADLAKAQASLTAVNGASSPTPSQPSSAAPQITHKHLSVNITPRGSNPIKYLVIHYAASSTSKPGTALAMYKTFTTRKASADFAVDDRDIVQLTPDSRKYYCASVGGKNYNNRGGKLYGICCNRNSISIEMCSTCSPANSTTLNAINHSGWSITPAVFENTVRLARYLMKEYNIPISRVIRHYDVNGKPCPGVIGWNDERIYDLNGKATAKYNTSSEWQRFLKALQ